LALKKLLRLDGTFDEAMEIEIGDNVFRNHPKGRNPGDVKSVAIGASAMEHFATMPINLALWTLRATLPHNGICLDPFMGTGTTADAALSLGGKFIGIDLDPNCINLAKQRLVDKSRRTD
jgi:DNA modification methylase